MLDLYPILNLRQRQRELARIEGEIRDWNTGADENDEGEFGDFDLHRRLSNGAEGADETREAGQ